MKMTRKRTRPKKKGASRFLEIHTAVRASKRVGIEQPPTSVQGTDRYFRSMRPENSVYVLQAHRAIGHCAE